MRKMERQPSSPGEILLHEFLIPLNLSQSAFARHIGLTQPKINEIVTGKSAVTPAMALIFADALNTTPQFWLGLQLSHDLWRAQQKHEPVKRLVNSSGQGARGY